VRLDEFGKVPQNMPFPSFPQTVAGKMPLQKHEYARLRGPPGWRYGDGAVFRPAAWNTMNQEASELSTMGKRLNEGPVARGKTWLESGDFERADRCFRAALRIEPASAEPYHLLGECAFHQRKVGEALEFYSRAINLGMSPEHSAERRWTCWMLLGEFDRAWSISDEVLGRKVSPEFDHDRPLHLRSVWRGEPLSGKAVLVRCYHGLGDSIQFIRYVALLHRICTKIIVQAPAALMPLFRSMKEIDEIIALEENAEEVTYDVDIEVLELPYAFRTTLATIPAAVPYLFLPEDKSVLERVPRSAHGKFRLGLAWSSGPWDACRSMSLDDLRPLFELRGVDLFSLQRGPEAAELRSSEIGWRITDLERGPASPMRTAGAIRDLDLVVSVDTMIAHLAGALGVPVWALLPFAADWRWLTGRDDSPWYPTMRLFRQGPERAWDQPVRRMCSELNRLIEDCGGTHP